MTNASIAPQVDMIPLSHLEADPQQPRQYFNPEQLQELKDSIASSGIITPLLYRKDGEKMIIVSGERRFKAATDLGLSEVPAQHVHGNYQLVALAENIQRNSLLPMEEARAIKRFMEESSLKQEDVAKQLGKAESTLSEILKPVELPEEMQQQALKSALWSRNKLLKLAKIKDAAQQRKEFERLRDSIAKTEALKRLKNAPDAVDASHELPPEKKVSKGEKQLKGLKMQTGLLQVRLEKMLQKQTFNMLDDEAKAGLSVLMKHIQSILKS